LLTNFFMIRRFYSNDTLFIGFVSVLFGFAVRVISHRPRHQCWYFVKLRSQYRQHRAVLSILCEIWDFPPLSMSTKSDIGTVPRLLSQKFKLNCFLTAGWSSGLRSRLQNQRSRVRIPVVGRGFCDEQLHLLTSHGCLYILLSI
jgi:hypothetical protein